MHVFAQKICYHTSSKVSENTNSRAWRAKMNTMTAHTLLHNKWHHMQGPFSSSNLLTSPKSARGFCGEKSRSSSYLANQLYSQISSEYSSTLKVVFLSLLRGGSLSNTAPARAAATAPVGLAAPQRCCRCFVCSTGNAAKIYWGVMMAALSALLALLIAVVHQMQRGVHLISKTPSCQTPFVKLKPAWSHRVLAQMSANLAPELAQGSLKRLKHPLLVRPLLCSDPLASAAGATRERLPIHLLGHRSAWSQLGPGCKAWAEAWAEMFPANSHVTCSNNP